MNSTAMPYAVQVLDERQQVAHVACEPVHRVNCERVALANAVERACSCGRLMSLPLALSVKYASDV